jgi:cellulose synthase (UDP-forming)
MSFYFEAFDHCVPPEPLVHAPARERVWQALALLSLALGAWYLTWRWGWSLNRQALWFAVPLVLAETLAYLGTALFIFNLWQVRDTDVPPLLGSVSV